MAVMRALAVAGAAVVRMRVCVRENDRAAERQNDRTTERQSAYPYAARQ